MKTSMKKLLAVMLTALLLIPCAVPAFAATKETVRQYGKEGGYLAIGDSISRGCGSDGFYLDQDKADGGQYLLNGLLCGGKIRHVTFIRFDFNALFFQFLHSLFGIFAVHEVQESNISALLGHFHGNSFADTS